MCRHCIVVPTKFYQNISVGRSPLTRFFSYVSLRGDHNTKFKILNLHIVDIYDSFQRIVGFFDEHHLAYTKNRQTLWLKCKTLNSFMIFINENAQQQNNSCYSIGICNFSISMRHKLQSSYQHTKYMSLVAEDFCCF